MQIQKPVVYTDDCEIARRELKLANKVYKRNRSDITRNLVILKRREYSKAKRTARYVYKSNQRKKFHDLSKTQPQKVWSEIRKI